MSMQRSEYFKKIQEDNSQKLIAEKHALLKLESKTGSFYKFCGIDTAHKILTLGNIQLQAPDRFNDPFDCLSGVGVWSNEGRFGPDNDEISEVERLLKKLPSKFQPLNFNVFHDLRSSYCFATSCFTTDFKNPLMWAHYAESHYGVCLEFKAEDLFEDIHPCLYANSMPEVEWRSRNLALSLIKCDAWRYENEWRYVRKTIRPIMRTYGTIANQIYNAVHSNPANSMPEYEEWDRSNRTIMEALEQKYNDERAIPIKPSAIFLGLRFGENYGNQLTLDKCEELLTIALKNRVAIKPITARSSSFELDVGSVADLPPWSPVCQSLKSKGL